MIKKTNEERLKNLSERMLRNNPMRKKEIVKRVQKTKRRNKRKENKERLKEKMSNEVKQILLGSLMGDAWLQKGGKINGVFREEHGKEQREYLLWKAEKLKKYFGKYKVYVRKNKKVVITLKSHPILNKYYKILYKDNKKLIRGSKIIKELDGLGLAIWFMDDGYNYKQGGYILSMSKKHDIENQKKNLIRKFGLKCSINDNGIYIWKESNKIFEKLVKEHIHPQLNYKIK